MRLRGSGTARIPLPGNLFPYFTAGPASGLDIQFYGMFNECTSIANVCSAIARELVNRFSRVGLCSYNGEQFFDRSLQTYSRRDPDAAIGLLYGIPEARRLPLGFERHRIRIGGFVCETDRIHSSWVDVCNGFDLICVPSEFCRRAFVDSGVVVPVGVVPHGLEAEYRPYHDPPDRGPFVFYNTFDAGSYPRRKGAEELIRSFTATFRASDNARLVLRTQRTEEIQALCDRYDRDAIVRVEPPGSLTTKEFAKRYAGVHCVVHPSRGEGFGLIPFQAIACERPVIATAATGMADFLNDENSLPLNTAGRIRGVALGNQTGCYYSIDEDHLSRLMRHVYETWPAEYEKVRTIGAGFRQRNTWQRVLAPFLATLEALLKSGSTTGLEEWPAGAASRQPPPSLPAARRAEDAGCIAAAAGLSMDRG